VTVASNIKPQDRAAAIRFVNQALDALDAVHSKLILWEKLARLTRPRASGAA
jgi:hypothetical protein